MNPLPLRKESLVPRIDGMQKNLIHLKKFAALTFPEFSKEEELYRICQEKLNDVEDFLSAIANFMKDPSRLGLTLE